MLLPAPCSGMVEIGSVTVTVPFFSPNGDGIQDFTTVSFEITSDLETVAVWVNVNDADGIPVRVLAEGEKRAPSKITKIWDGRTSSGETAPEGTYTFEIFAIGDSQTAGPVWASVRLDNTAPGFNALIWPNPYSPDIEPADSVVTIEITPLDASPQDRVIAWIVIDEEPDTLCGFEITETSSSLVCTWDGRNQQDGLYSLWLKALDRAGNSSTGSYLIDLDIEGPSIGFLHPLTSILTSLPDSVSGFIHDRNGIDSLGLRFTEEGRFTYPTVRAIRDTVFWSAVWPESLLMEGEFRLECIGTDSLGHWSSQVFTVTVDTTPPMRPVLAALPSETGDPEVEVSGTSTPLDSVIVYVNDEPGGRGKCSASGTFSISVTLDLGSNWIYAIAIDVAGHVSAPSETLWIEYVERPGIWVPEHLQSDSSIEVNLARKPSNITMHVYSLDGEHVASVVWKHPSQYGEYQWDLRDGEGNLVRNGVYVLIFEIDYTDGGSTVERKAVVISR